MMFWSSSRNIGLRQLYREFGLRTKSADESARCKYFGMRYYDYSLMKW